MFYIYLDKLYLAEPNLTYSHAVWFERLGLISKSNDELMEEIVRGFIDSKGNIYFYAGYDFRISDKSEKIFFSFLPELIEKLKLNFETEVFGGVKIKPDHTKIPRKEYGKVKNLLAKER